MPPKTPKPQFYLLKKQVEVKLDDDEKLNSVVIHVIFQDSLEILISRSVLASFALRTGLEASATFCPLLYGPMISPCLAPA